MEDHGLTDERLRALYQRALATRGERTGCVEPEAILAVVRREGAEDRRLATLDHVMGCRACRGELDLLRSIESANAEAKAEAKRATPRWRWGWAAPIAMAASFSLVVAVAYKLTRGGVVVVVERGGGQVVDLLSPPADIEATAPVVFVWKPVSGALRYDLEVLDEQGKVVFAETTEKPLVKLDRRLPPGTYRWWVRAAVGADEPRASDMRRLRIKP